MDPCHLRAKCRILVIVLIIVCCAFTFYKLAAEEREHTGYYKLRREKINPQDFKFLIENPTFCYNRSDLFLLALVPSVHSERQVRNVIRDSWGSYPSVNMKLAFLFGAAENDAESAQIQEEYKQHGDIVQADFIESYSNLTYKILMGLRWVSLHCKHVRYVLKADTDMFVDIRLLVDVLTEQTPGPNGTIYCLPNEHPRVPRSGRWAVPKSLYPMKYFPTHARGPAYVISGKAAASLYAASQYFPYLHLEDVLLTGILRKVIGIEMKSGIGFAWQWNRSRLNTETFPTSEKMTYVNLHDVNHERLDTVLDLLHKG